MTKILDITPKERQVAIRSDSLVTQSALDREAETRKLIKGYISQNLKKGTDFYELNIGGRTSKPSLSKPGSEKFMSLFHLRAEFERDNDTWEMAGRKDGLLCYVCKLYTKNGLLVGEGRGARDMMKDNGDANKAIKMAQKSAQIDAILRTGALSDFFTQDIEDMKDESLDQDPALQEAQKHDKIVDQKARIMKLLNQIHLRKVTQLEEIQHLIQQHTDLPLEVENYSEIIARLNTLLIEQREVQKGN